VLLRCGGSLAGKTVDELLLHFERVPQVFKLLLLDCDLLPQLGEIVLSGAGPGGCEGEDEGKTTGQL